MEEYEIQVAENDKQIARIMQLESGLRKKLGIKEGVPGLELKYCGESKKGTIFGIFLEGKIFKYFDTKGAELLNVDDLTKKSFWFKKSLYLLGYNLNQEDGGIYKIDGNVRIYETSYSYFEVLKNAQYLMNKLIFGTFGSADSQKYSKPFPISSLEKYIDLKLLKFRDAELLIEANKLSNNDGIKLKKIIRDNILNQCQDERYDMTGDEITKSDLDSYLKKKYIDKKLHKKCLDIIQKKDFKKIERIKIISDTKGSLEGEKIRNQDIIDRA